MKLTDHSISCPGEEIADRRRSSSARRSARACTPLAAAVACVFSLLSLLSCRAHADEVEAIRRDGSDPRAVDDAAVARLGAYLHESASGARDSRFWLGLSGLVSGVLLLPPGIVLIRRDDSLSQSIGLGMVIGGSLQLAFSSLDLIPSKMEAIAARFEARRASGMSPVELIRVTEAEWRASASRSRYSRIVVGIVALGLGGASAAVGLGLVLAPPGVGNLSQVQQYDVGTSLIAPGLPILASGIRSLILQTPEERAWATYRIMAGVPASARFTLTAPDVGIAPLRGGGLGVATFSF